MQVSYRWTFIAFLRGVTSRQPAVVKPKRVRAIPSLDLPPVTQHCIVARKRPPSLVIDGARKTPTSMETTRKFVYVMETLKKLSSAGGVSVKTRNVTPSRMQGQTAKDQTSTPPPPLDLNRSRAPVHLLFSNRFLDCVLALPVHAVPYYYRFHGRTKTCIAS